MTRGYVAIVDDDVFDEIAAFSWRVLESVDGQRYAHRSLLNCEGRGRNEYMHRRIAAAPRGMNVDHIDGNGLHNWRANLRLASVVQNGQNLKKHRDGSSRFKGVSWSNHLHKWTAQIQIDRVYTRLGAYVVEEEAARAYDAAARRHFGEFARVNFPLAGERSACG